MIAITTSSSIRVKPRRKERGIIIIQIDGLERLGTDWYGRTVSMAGIEGNPGE
jgi:hypothetical protein